LWCRVGADGSFISWGSTFPTQLRCTPCSQLQAIKARSIEAERAAAVSAKASISNWNSEFNQDDEWDGEIIEVD